VDAIRYLLLYCPPSSLLGISYCGVDHDPKIRPHSQA